MSKPKKTKEPSYLNADLRINLNEMLSLLKRAIKRLTPSSGTIALVLLICQPLERPDHTSIPTQSCSIARQIQHQQPSQNFLVAHFCCVVRPTVSRCDGGIQFGVCVGEPSGTGVVEVG